MNDGFLHNCLFFTANRLSRAITKMAEEVFASTGLTPMYGYLILLVNGTPGISQKELAEKLCITPSTLTRFIDKLEGKQYLERKVHGKTVLVYPTDKSHSLEESIRRASSELHDRYSDILGQEASKKLTKEIDLISEQINRH
ncbi:MarR family winged helix-turn-helix transcriptional regulator [Paenibacillus sp. SI8]|uniref:MarR family winged helix-turn-helix transcriptional regulator n=1 Tax=unclassified Paenibacillus TaxID=185978 RepID=UPI00346691B6